MNNKLARQYLFRNIDKEEIGGLLKIMGAWRKRYKKGEYIYLAGDEITAVGIVLSGKVYITNDMIGGYKNILACIEENDFFGETYALLKDEPILVNVESGADTEVIFFDIRKICFNASLKTASEAQFMQNIVQMLAEKNIGLSRKILYTSLKSIREKILAYLNEQSRKQHKSSIVIPFNRQELADFLGINRSALSKELSTMKKEGLIDYNKNRFELLKTMNDSF